jgi:23S rRNA (cytidine1920-2'-O)/16S rRNA (cytidine1409-2'-O)-methyltransferase
MQKNQKNNKVRLRLDNALVERGIMPSRAKALGAIMAGTVKLNGQIETKAGKSVKEDDTIELVQNACPYVSRGGLKLKAAIDAFSIDVKDRVCLDVGAATGGFTDCFLKEGAKHVYAIDVGKGQFDYNLSKNPKVIFIPNTNARYLSADIFGGDLPTIGAIDVSFISLKLILPPVINSMEKSSDIIALIKPQFELSRKEVPGGIVKDDTIRLKAISSLKEFILANKELNLPVSDCGIITSPLKGAKGNIEFLWRLKVEK